MTDAPVRQIELEVHGLPPAKSEARSMLGADHPHRERVVHLLAAADELASASGFEPILEGPVALDLVVRASRDDPRLADGPNFVGGVADVLQRKAHLHIPLDHLSGLREVALYNDDRQIEAMTCRFEPAAIPSYRLCIWAI